MICYYNTRPGKSLNMRHLVMPVQYVGARTLSEKEIEEAKKAIRKGRYVKDVAKSLGVSEKTLRRCFADVGFSVAHARKMALIQEGL